MSGSPLNGAGGANGRVNGVAAAALAAHVDGAGRSKATGVLATGVAGESPVDAAAATSDARVIGFVLKAWPRLSETFVLREILLLEAMGHTLHLFAMRRPQGVPEHEMLRRVRAAVTYVPDQFWRQLGLLASANAALLLRRPVRYLAALGLALARSASERRISTLKRFLQAGYLVARALPGTGVAHLHAHFSHDPTTMAFFASRLSGLPYSFSAHAKDIYTEHPELLRRKIAGARFVTTCTEFNRGFLEKRGNGRTPILRCYHGVDLHAFEERRVERVVAVPVLPSNAGRTGIAPGEAHVLSIGRLVPKKGFDTLLEAVAALRGAGHAVRCTIVGGGPEEPALRRRIAALGLEDRVALHPPMAQDQLIGLYRTAHVFALACQVEADGDRDGIPNVLLEAMAMGVPVVSTAISGIPEVVDHEVSGLLVRERDARALAEAIASLIERPERARALGRAGRRRIENDFEAVRNFAPIAAALGEAVGIEPRELCRVSGG